MPVLPPDEQTKFIVFESKLLDLFTQCPVCTADTVGRIRKIVGTAVHVEQLCSSCKYVRSWCSQPYCNQMPVGNLLLSGAILFSGSLLSKVLRMFKILQVACISSSTFHRHQTNYLAPTILTHWSEERSQLLDVLRLEDEGLVIAGDGQCDSPGHCAKYGSFTVMEQRLKKIIDFELVQV